MEAAQRLVAAETAAGAACKPDMAAGNLGHKSDKEAEARNVEDTVAIEKQRIATDAQV